jgi:hypothetical protein
MTDQELNIVGEGWKRDRLIQLYNWYKRNKKEVKAWILDELNIFEINQAY